MCVVCGVADPSLGYERASTRLPCSRTSVAEFFFDYLLHDILELSSVEEANGRFLCLDCFEIVSECDENEEDQSRMLAGLKELIMRGSRAAVRRRREKKTPQLETKAGQGTEVIQEIVSVGEAGVEEVEVSRECGGRMTVSG